MLDFFHSLWQLIPSLSPSLPHLPPSLHLSLSIALSPATLRLIVLVHNSCARARTQSCRSRSSHLPCLIQSGMSRLMSRERCAASQASGKRFFTADMTKECDLLILLHLLPLLHLFNLIPSTHRPSTLPRLTRRCISCIPGREGDLFFNCNGTNNFYYAGGGGTNREGIPAPAPTSSGERCDSIM